MVKIGPRRRVVRRRGVALLLALMAVAIAAILAASFLGAQSTTIGITRNIEDHAEARHVAESGLVLAVAHVRSNDTWRTDRTNGTWVTDQGFGPGTFTVVGLDGVDTNGDGVISVPAEGDGDLTDDDSDRVTLTSTGKVNGVTHRVRAVITPTPVAGDLLFVVDDPASLSGGDATQQSLFEGWGWTVTLQDDDDSSSSFATAMAANDLALVSESASAADVASKLVNATQGVVLERIDLGDEFGLTQSQDAKNDTANFDVIDTSHPITSTFSPGVIDLFTSNQTMHRQMLSIAAGATVLGNYTVGSKPCLYAVEAGGSLYGGGTAAGRRLQLPWGQGADYSALTSDGRTLFQKALEWASQGGSGAVFGYQTSFTDSGNNIDGKQMATQVTLDTDRTLLSISAYVQGPPPKLIRYAIYSDSGGEPGTLLAQTDTKGIASSSFHWHTIGAPSVALTAGTYWLALSFEHSTVDYKYDDAGGQSRQTDNDAISGDFSATWGGSSGSGTDQISIYATTATGGGGGRGYNYTFIWQE